MKPVTDPWLAPPLRLYRLPGETLAGIWARRAVSWTLLAALTVGLGSTAPLWLGVLWAWDHLKGVGDHRPRTRCGALVLVYLVAQVVGLLGAGCLALVTLGGCLGGHQRYRRSNSWLQGWWAEKLFWSVARVLDLKVEVQGPETALPSPFLLYVRHTSLLDTLLASVVIANPYRRRLRYVLKRELLWDPCLDVVGRRLPNVFVERGGEAPRRELAALRGLASDLELDEGVLIYPEGTRFSEKKLEKAKQRLSPTENGRTDLARGFRHVLPPRLGGALALLEGAPAVDVVLLSHTGLEKAADLSGAWSGRLIGGTLKIRLTVVRREAIPEENREDWLFRLWSELDQWVEENR